MTAVGWPWRGLEEEEEEEEEEERCGLDNALATCTGRDRDESTGTDGGEAVYGVAQESVASQVGDASDSPTLWPELVEMTRIAVPTALSNAFEYLPVCTAMVVVGGLPGDEGRVGLDAVSLGRAFFNITAMAPVFGMLGAMRTLCPQAVGAGRPELLGLYVQQAALVMAALALPCVALQFFAADILSAVGQDRELAELAGAYCVRLVPQFFGIASMVVLQRVYQAHKMVWSNLFICAAGCAAAPPLQLLLVRTMGFGYLGAAWAASIYNCLFTAMQIVHMHAIGMGSLFAPRLREAVEWAQMQTYLSLALPSFLQSMLKWAAMEVIVLLSGVLNPPDRALVASSMGINILGLLLMGWIGILVAVAVSVGRYIGAGNVVAARQAATAGMLAATLLGALAALVLFLGHEHVVAAFTHDLGLQALSSSVLKVLAGLVFMDAVNNALGGVMSGLGLQRAIAGCQLVGYYCIGNPLGIAVTFLYFHGTESGVFALWGGNMLAMLTSIILQAAVLARHKWEESVKESMTRLYLLDSQHGETDDGTGEGSRGALQEPLLRASFSDLEQPDCGVTIQRRSSSRRASLCSDAPPQSVTSVL